MTTRPVSILFCAALALLAPAVAPMAQQALPQLEPEDGLDAGFARGAVLRGEILPLDQILKILRAEFDGQIVEIQLELEEGILTYEFDILSPDGRLFEVEIDAASGKILEVEDEDDD
ncbi:MULTISPECIES: PepSY domain-containing protein [Paracoccus]|uniref:Peptidase n=1 Tax=Paracoccus litorisediminis TaxID=2006130 RepID=A0A844HRY0_9RHOB|nr:MULTISPECIES: PepSY domain-containing protein [Paracoccus]MBD9527755.1 PepSY domain-containing protein [Paracoccus sp. PAR01]MTH60391.1 peptidase [Paracoccus litorisediminis]